MRQRGHRERQRVTMKDRAREFQKDGNKGRLREKGTRERKQGERGFINIVK